jgi:hypothetical protein
MAGGWGRVADLGGRPQPTNIEPASRQPASRAVAGAAKRGNAGMIIGST